MREDEPCLLRGGDLECLRADVRIAVAVTADPAAHGEKRRQPGCAQECEARAQGFFQVRVQARDPRNESEAEIRERIGDLVRDGELGEAQHRREPQPQHLRVQGAIAPGRGRQRDQARDLALAFEDALALHFGGMRGQHRAHAGAREPSQERLARLCRRALQSIREAPRPPRRAAFRVRAAPAVLVRVLGDIEEMRKIAERSHHVQRLLDRQRVELRLQLRLDRLCFSCERRVGQGPPEPHRGLADGLDALAGLGADLLADHVAEEAAEQPPILAQQLLFLVPGLPCDRVHARKLYPGSHAGVKFTSAWRPTGPRYIGGTWPFRPTLTRAAVRVPSGWRCVTVNTLAPGLSSLRSVGVKDTITAFSGTSTFFSPPLYCTVRTRSLPMLVTLATFALVILLVGLKSQS